MAACAIAGVIIGSVGLRTWRKQLEGKARFEVARAFVRAAYEFEDRFLNLRKRFLYGSEIPLDENTGRPSTDPARIYSA